MLRAWARVQDEEQLREEWWMQMAFAERIQDLGDDLLPYYQRVAFTDPDEEKARGAMGALTVLAGFTETSGVMHPRVVDATLLALANEGEFPGAWIPGEWMENGDVLLSLRKIYHTLDRKAQGVLIRRLPYAPPVYIQNPLLIRCYIDFLSHPDPQVHEAAVRQVHDLMPFSDVGTPDLLLLSELLAIPPDKNEESVVESVAVAVLRLLDEPSDGAGIVGVFGKAAGLPLVQMHLAAVCTMFRPLGVTETLASALQSPEPMVRIHVLQALRALGDVAALDAVIPLLSDSDDLIRCMAVWTAGRLRDERVPALLTNALADPDLLVARAAERSLAEFVPPGIELPRPPIQIP